jgi:hypothetical protein
VGVLFGVNFFIPKLMKIRWSSIFFGSFAPHFQIKLSMHTSNFNSRFVSMSELELFLLTGVLTPNFSTMDLIKIREKNLKLHIQGRLPGAVSPGRLPWPSALAIHPWPSGGCRRPTAYRPLDAGSQHLRPTATPMLKQPGVQVAKQALFHSTSELYELVPKGLVLHFVSLAW